MIGQNDLRIPLCPSLIAPVANWVSTFTTHEDCWIEYPRILNQTLHISALAFPFFLAYADPHESTELDLRRLKIAGKQAIQKALNTSVHSRASRAYSKALENIELLGIGEFLML